MASRESPWLPAEIKICLQLVGKGGKIHPGGVKRCSLGLYPCGRLAHVSGETVRKPAKASVPCCSEFLFVVHFKDTGQKGLMQSSPYKNHLRRKKPRLPSAAEGGGRLGRRHPASSRHCCGCVAPAAGLLRAWQREALPLARPHTPGVREEKMKEQSGGPSISLHMFRRPLTKKIKKSVYKMECQEHCVKEHLSGRL